MWSAATREAAAGHLWGWTVANKWSLLLARVKMQPTTPRRTVLPGAQKKSGTRATAAASLPTLSQMCPPGTCASCWAFRCDRGRSRWRPWVGGGLMAVQLVNGGET